MSSVSFAVGPARVDTQLVNYCREAYDTGILSINHRSDDFHTLWKRFIALCRSRLAIPNEYAILCTSSATECWAIIAQSISQSGGLHIFNGQMGHKWFQTAKRIHNPSTAAPFDPQTTLPIPSPKMLRIHDIVCVTHNETANGTALSIDTMVKLKNICQETNALLAVDATSSLGGVAVPVQLTDFCFASVQKCLGIPAGMAILVASPRAIAHAKQLNEAKHYNSFLRILQHFEQNEAPYTPNVMAIYLLSRVLENRPSIQQVDEQSRYRSAQWDECIAHTQTLLHYVTNPKLRSPTVLCLKHPNPQKILKSAFKDGFPISRGYGALKANTLRIANFPAIQQEEITNFMKYLSRF